MPRGRSLRNIQQLRVYSFDVIEGSSDSGSLVSADGDLRIG